MLRKGEMMNCKCERRSKSRRIPSAHPGGGVSDDV